MKKQHAAGALLLAMAVGIGISGACDSSVTPSEDVKDGYLVSWSPDKGFWVEGTVGTAIEALASKLTPPRDPLAERPLQVLWAVGDGVSMPFLVNVNDLPKDQLWPDVIVPESSMAVGTELKIWTVNEGKLDKLVTDVIVDEFKSAELPYFSVTRSRCFAFCGNECNNCNWCSSCGGSCGWGPATTSISASRNCNTVCGSCTGASQHYCYTSTRNVTCTTGT